MSTPVQTRFARIVRAAIRAQLGYVTCTNKSLARLAIPCPICNPAIGNHGTMRSGPRGTAFQCNVCFVALYPKRQQRRARRRCDVRLERFQAQSLRRWARDFTAGK